MTDWNKATESVEGIKTIKIELKNSEEIEFNIKIKTGLVPDYLKKMAEFTKSEDISKIVDYRMDFCKNLILDADKTAPKDKVALFVETNFAEVIKEISISLGLAKRKDFETVEEAKN